MAVIETVEVAPNARCALHPQVPAVSTCRRCGSYACHACTHGHDGSAYCASCVDQLPILADRGRRLAAVMLDSLLIATAMSAGLIMGIAAAWAGLGGSAGSTVGTVLGALGVLLVLGWNLVLVDRHGQTLAKRWLGIRVVRRDGSRADLGRIIVLRNLLPGLIAAVPLAGNLFSFLDALFILRKDQRCIHDMIADTIVIQAGPSRSSRAPRVPSS